jgi:hypothetical protein
VKWRRAFSGLMSGATLLVPLMTAADSRLRAGAPDTALSASAQLNFRIVIPQFLSVATGGADNVSIITNSRSLTLSAGIRMPDSNVRVQGNTLLSAPAGRVIARDSRCTPERVAAAAKIDSRRIVCTASMP